MAATLLLLIVIAVVASLGVLLIDRRAGPFRTVLTIAVAFGGAWATSHFAAWLAQLTVAGVVLIPAILGALVAAFLFRYLSHGVGGKKRVQ